MLESGRNDITVVDAQRESATGQRVCWGGEIVGVTVGELQTCFEVSERPLAPDTRPREAEATLGRVITCAPGYYDPAIYEHGHALTVVGTLEHPVVGRIGTTQYCYPRVAAERLYLWPPREPAPGFYEPWTFPCEESFWGPWTTTPWGD